MKHHHQLRSHPCPCHTPFLSTLLPCSRSNDYPASEEHSLTFIILACLCILWKWNHKISIPLCLAWFFFPLLNVCLWDSSTVLLLVINLLLSFLYTVPQYNTSWFMYLFCYWCMFAFCYFKAIKNGVVDRHIEQWNRTKSPEIDPYVYGQVFFEKSIQWGKVHL